jgi:catechol 2,3-dioxygenase-like lactoylglutathione lyase family enzyme
MIPRISGVHETVLYGPDIPRLTSFYASVLGLRVVHQADDDSAALRMPEGDAVLLLFHPGHASTPGRGVPTHGATGPGHVAFRVPPGTLPAWFEQLQREGVEIEMERGWSRGGASLYFRDPAGNSVELIEGDVWEV